MTQPEIIIPMLFIANVFSLSCLIYAIRQWKKTVSTLKQCAELREAQYLTNQRLLDNNSELLRKLIKAKELLEIQKLTGNGSINEV